MAFKIFNQIKVDVPQSNTFDLSHDIKLTLKMGSLVPFYVQECLPTDKFNISTESLIRFAPMIAPAMANVNVYYHYFFVPNRILWDGWEKFITNQNDPAPRVAPYIMGTDEIPLPIEPGDVLDYMGLPLTPNMKEPINALPLAAYIRIFQEYYADQNVQPEVALNPIKLQDGLNTFVSDVNPKPFNRAYEHDYFTSGLPWAQKGDAVNIPLYLNGQADVNYKVPSVPSQMVVPGTDTPLDMGNISTDENGFITDGTNTGQLSTTNLQADLEGQGLLSGTINDLRRAFAIQKWLELAARAGSRYKENIKAFFGYDTSDGRLQRPEYIGGSKQNVVISEVLQTSETTENSPQANMSGHGLSAGSGQQASYFCEEHGFIIGIMSVLPKTGYMQGIPRQFSKFTPYDYYWKQFANIGEQEIKGKELYYDNDDEEGNESTFAYIPRYAEYRYVPSRCAGDMRTSLLFWNLDRKFDNRPELNTDFIYCKPENTTRIFAVEDPDTDPLIAHIFVKNWARRPLPLFGTPAGL